MPCANTARPSAKRAIKKCAGNSGRISCSTWPEIWSPTDPIASSLGPSSADRNRIHYSTNRADVLWGLADQVVLNPKTVQSILLFSLRNRIPFVGLSSTWVKAGALYALDRDYGDIGAQCGELAVKVLQGAPPASLSPAGPRKVVYAINMKTARLLKLEIQDSLVQGAQAVFN